MEQTPQWQCLVCGYVHTGSTPPEECPICFAPMTAFEQMDDSADQTAPEVVDPRPADHRYLIIGNSSAGRSAAKAIRSLQQDARVTIVCEESVDFYYRPILPDLIGGMEEWQIFSAGKTAYPDTGLEIMSGETVASVDTAARTVRCMSGAEMPFDSLLIASGGVPITLPWPGSDASGIAYFRCFSDAKAIAEAARSCVRAVVVGGGLLGLEFVRAFIARRVPVTLLVREDRVGFPGLDKEAGSIIERRLAELGVDVALEEQVESFESADGRVTGVRTNAGRTIPCGIVGVAIGVRPRIDFLQGSGIETDRGVLADNGFRTNMPGIYAAGDVAQAFDPAYGIARVNTSWRTAREQGETAGLNMAGADVCCNGTIGSNYQVFGGIPFVSVGYANPEAESESIRIEKALDDGAGTYEKLVYRDGVLVGAVLVGDASRAGEIERAIREALI